MVLLKNWFISLDPVGQAAVAGLFTWGLTATGAMTVVLISKMSRRVLDAMLGFAAGVMTAASFWSLLAPAIEMEEFRGNPAWIPAVVGFLAGGVAMRLADAVIPHVHPRFSRTQAEGIPTRMKRSTLLVLAITLHNVPEGLAVGFAFGAVASGLATAQVTTLGSAVALAIGIGIQNFPEGIAVAMPLRAEGMSRTRSFFFGQASALVEPIAAVIGAIAVLAIESLLPYALAFAAGAMIFVVVEELIPESHSHDNDDLATTSALFGFAVMMLLDVMLG